MQAKTKEMFYEKVEKARALYNMYMQDYDRTTFEINEAYKSIENAVAELNKIEYETSGLFYSLYYVYTDKQGMAHISASLKCNEKDDFNERI